jgi:uncharacterized membrane protein
MDGSANASSSEELQRELEDLKRRIEAIEAALRPSNAAPLSRSEQEANSAIATAPSKASPPSANQAAVQEARLGRPSALESRIGAQLFNRVGIFAVLAAAAWFLRLAFDRAWIGPGLRVIVGLLVAAALVLWSERFRQSGAVAFSYTLKALASGIAYLSLWACFNLYHLLPSGMVFVGMVGVTITNAVLAWRQDSELLAALALAGGLATPALLSTGSDQEVFLFSYLLLLDIGGVALAAARPWPRLVAGAFVGTTVYFGFWSFRYYTSADESATGWFIGLFFALFTTAPYVAFGKITSDRRLSGRELLAALPIAAGVCAFLEAERLASITAAPADISWINSCIAAALGAIYLLLTIAAEFWKDDAAHLSRILRMVHLALAVGFVALAALLRFHGFGIPLCWLAELCTLTVAAFYLRDHTLARPLRGNGAVMLMLSFCALLLLRSYDRQPFGTEAFLNAHFATYLCGLLVFAGVVTLARKTVAHESAEKFSLESFRIDSWKFLMAFAVIAFNLLALIAVSLQIGLYWQQQLPPMPRGFFTFHHPAYVDLTYSAWFMIYGAALMTAGFLRRSAFLRWQALVLLTLSIGKVFLFDTSHLTAGYRVASFLALGVLLIAVSYVYQRDLLGLRGEDSGAQP